MVNLDQHGKHPRELVPPFAELQGVEIYEIKPVVIPNIDHFDSSGAEED